MLSQGIHITLWQCTQLVLIGTFFNYMMPGGVGGDLIKGYYIAQNSPENKMKAVVSVLMDRLLGLFSMLLMAISVLLWERSYLEASAELRWIFYLLCIVFVGFLCFWTVVFSRRVYEWQIFRRILAHFAEHGSVRRLYHALVDYRHAKTTILPALGLSLLSQIGAVFFFYLCGQAMGFGDIPFEIYFFVVPVGFIIQAIPISPAGIGVGQAAFLFLFQLATHQESSLGPAAITAFQVITLLYGLAGAYFYLGISKKLKQAQQMTTAKGEL